MRRALNSFMPYKAHGPDGTYPICLQKGLDMIIKYLIKVYRGSITGHIPKPRRNVRVVLIPIPGRNPSLAKFCRPISLSFFKLKTLERRTERFLREGTLTRHSLQESQHAHHRRGVGINRNRTAVARNKDKE